MPQPSIYSLPAERVQTIADTLGDFAVYAQALSACRLSPELDQLTSDLCGALYAAHAKAKTLSAALAAPGR